MKRFMMLLPAVALSGQVALAATSPFGFSGPEVFPIDPQVSLLHVADLDGDGLNDIIVANNLHSKINLLYNLTGKTNRTETQAGTQRTAPRFPLPH